MIYSTFRSEHYLNDSSTLDYVLFVNSSVLLFLCCTCHHSGKHREVLRPASTEIPSRMALQLAANPSGTRTKSIGLSLTETNASPASKIQSRNVFLMSATARMLPFSPLQQCTRRESKPFSRTYAYLSDRQPCK